MTIFFAFCTFNENMTGLLININIDIDEARNMEALDFHLAYRWATEPEPGELWMVADNKVEIKLEQQKKSSKCWMFYDFTHEEKADVMQSSP